MKRVKTTLLIVMALLMIPLTQAQDSKSQAFWVHEDVVKPSMIGEYEAICKELTNNLKKHNIQEVNTIVTNTADSRYLWVSPIESMSDIEKPVFADLAKKIGKTAMDDLFKRMDKCYDVEQNYVIHLDKELSYMPSGITQTPEGQDYRKFHYLYLTPENRALVKEKMITVKKLFQAKESKMDYRVYKSGFGTRGEFYMVAIAAKDAVDYAQKSMKNDALLGEEGKQALGAVYGSLMDFEEIVGRMRPGMAYSPSN